MSTAGPELESPLGDDCHPETMQIPEVITETSSAQESCSPRSKSSISVEEVKLAAKARDGESHFSTDKGYFLRIHHFLKVSSLAARPRQRLAKLDNYLSFG